MEAICDANEKFEANNFEKTMRSLSTALYADPENIKIQAKIAKIQRFFIKNLVERLEKEVEEDLTEACVKLEIDKKTAKIETLLTQGKVEKAEKLMTEVSASDSEHKDLKFLKGLSLWRFLMRS